VQRQHWIGIVIIALLALGLALVLGATWLPVEVLRYYPATLLLEEAERMGECAACHEAATFHTCDTCHNEHGSAVLEGFPFYAGVTLAGDVPQPGYILLNDVLLYSAQPYIHLSLLDFLAEQGAADFESVTLTSLDGGFITISRENLTPNGLLLPYEDGIRFAAEDLHISTWIKGIRGFIVVGPERPLEIDGEATSIGRLLLGPRHTVTVDLANVMLRSEEDGEVRSAQAGRRLEGVLVSEIVANPAFERLTVQTADGATHTLTIEEAWGALLVQLRGTLTLVLPERGQPQWLSGVTALRSE